MNRLDQLIAEGRATPAVGDLVKYLKANPPLPAVPGEPLASEILAEMRRTGPAGEVVAAGLYRMAQLRAAEK